MRYCHSPFLYQRRKTREVMVGDPAQGGVIIGGNHPIVKQSMLTCDTMDTEECVKQSLERTIGAPCPYCQSTGYVKSLTTVANEIYVEMRKMAKHLEQEDVMLRVHPDVAKELKANNGRLLNEMEELTKRTIIVKSDPAVHQEQFDIN